MPTTVKRVQDWFFLKPDFTSFQVYPDKHSGYLFGVEDRALRDSLITSLEEHAYSVRGHRAVIYGRAGRGKTHLAHHLVAESRKRNLLVEPIYVHCPTLVAKASVTDLLAAMMKAIPPETATRIARNYLSTKTPEKERRVRDEVEDPMIYDVMVNGLESHNPNAVRKVLSWLGGMPADVTNHQENAPSQITDENQLAQNLGGLAELLMVAEGKNLIFLLDEAERIAAIKSGDTHNLWLALLRGMFRRPSLGLIIFVIAANRDYLPDLLLEEEVMSSIGPNHVHESAPFSVQSAQSFLQELLEAMIQHDPCPEALQQLLQQAGESLETYPFTRDAFEEFINQHSIGTTLNKPREMINNLESLARRAMTRDKRLIDRAVLQEISEGM